MDDMELLRRYTAYGDKEAISCLVQKYQKMVFAACLRRLGCAADAEDATQQVFLAMMRHGGGIHSNVKQWLYRCALNVSASLIRSRRNRIRREYEKGRQSPAFGGNGEAERKETLTIIRRCLGELDTTDRKVLLETHVHDMTQQAIATSLGVTQQAVAKRIGKALYQLRRELSSRGVIFSLLAATVLLVKRAAAAAIPQSIKGALSTVPSASLATSGTATAGTAGVMKVGAAAALALAAVATYEYVGKRQSDPPANPAKVVSLASAEKPPAGGGMVVPGCFPCSSPFAPPIFPAGGSLAQEMPAAGQASRPTARRGAEASDPPLANRQATALSGRQDSLADRQNEIGRQTAPSPTSDFRGTFHSRRFDASAAKTSGSEAAQRDSTEKFQPEATVEEIAKSALGNVSRAFLSLEAIPFEEENRRADRRVLFPPDRQIERGEVTKWDTPYVLRNHTTTPNPLASAPCVAFGESFADVGGNGTISPSLPLSNAAPPSLHTSGILGTPKETIVPAGTLLAAAGTLDGRLINQGMLATDGANANLHLTGLVSGAGSYTGCVVFSGGFSPGNSPAAVSLDSAILDKDNVLTMELGGLIAGKEYDQLLIKDLLTLGGHLEVKLIDGFVPQWGNSFTLFGGNLSGRFVDMALPELNDGLRWDTGSLYGTGSLQVVPEPTSLSLLTACLAALLRRSRRR